MITLIIADVAAAAQGGGGGPAGSEFWAEAGPWALTGVGLLNLFVLGALIGAIKKASGEIKLLREHVDARVSSLYKHMQDNYTPRELVTEQLSGIAGTLKAIQSLQKESRDQERYLRDQVVRLDEHVKRSNARNGKD